MPSSNSPSIRPLRRPPEDLDRFSIPRGQAPGRDWFRVHQSRHDAVFFSVNANHRFSHPDSPCKLLYLGSDLNTCLFERFGDEVYDRAKSMPESLWKCHCATMVRCPPLQICDLTNPKTLAALRVDYTALMSEKLSIPQEWGLAIQRHPSHFQGIKYKSRFNGRNCLVIFDRDDIAKRIHADRALGPLEDCDPAVDWIAEHKICLY